MPLKTWSTNEVLGSADLNANFTICVLTDTIRTITVTHEWSASQNFNGGLATDTISEKTAATGVTIDGVLLKDSKVGPTYGGTDQTSWTKGDLLYASDTNVLSRLGGNTAATKKFLQQTGTGAASAAPSWGALVAADYPEMVGADGSNAGTRGAVPAPGASDNTKFLRGDGTYQPTTTFRGAKVYKDTGSGDQAISNATLTKVTFPTEESDAGGLVATSTFTAQEACDVLVIARVFLNGGSATGDKRAYIYKNGVAHSLTIIHDGAPGSVCVEVSDVITCALGDTIEIYTFHQCGTGVVATAGQTATRASFAILGTAA